MIGYNIKVYLNDRELDSDCLISTLGNSLSSAYDFQKRKQEMIQVKFILENKQN